MSLFKIGAKVLITTDCWFIAPDGQSYKSVHGTIKAVRSAEESLGIKTNAKSTNWYVEIGDMLLAGCQIHYAIACDRPFLGKVIDPYAKTEADARPVCMIYDADF